MKQAVKVDLINGMVTFEDGSQKTIDNYIFELEERLMKVHEILHDFEDADPNNEYLVDGEILFYAMDMLEGR